MALYDLSNLQDNSTMSGAYNLMIRASRPSMLYTLTQESLCVFITGCPQVLWTKDLNHGQCLSSSSSSSSDKESSRINFLNLFIYIMQWCILNLIAETKNKVKIAKLKLT
jgi:hypothetical protein